MTHFFTADWHLWHRNIIRLCNRPFATVEEMNETIIHDANNRVGPYDHLWILGDYLWKRKALIPVTLQQLRCKHVHIVFGNHDDAARKMRGCFESSHELFEINVGNQAIVLCHYPMRSWHKSRYGAWQLYGHHHGTLPEDPHLFSMDMGVDTHHHPWSFDEVKAYMDMKASKMGWVKPERRPRGEVEELA